MEFRTLGKTGIKVSRHCLGAMMFGALGNPDHDDCVRIVHAALDGGINFIDTADVYSNGESEEIVGKAIKGRRDDVVLATKFFGVMPGADGDATNRQGASRRWIVTEVENSLRRLGVDHIDLYQQHRFDSSTAPEETLSALTDLVRQGKIRAFGSSTFGAERIVEAQWTSDRLGLERYRCDQPPYSIFRRGIERAVLPTCRRYGMGVIVWSPLDGGWLSGRYRTAADFDEGSRIVRLANRWGGFDPEAELNRRKLELVGHLATLADDAGIPMAHLATAWVLEHPDVTSAIIGPRTMPQLEDSLASAGLRIPTEILDAIDELVPPGTDVNPFDPSSAPRELEPTYRRR
ncbi:MAG: aldo/keto reductase [Actinomycetia bacterium]|nr:aldo/keto reductase [Actinomycetes bacterium]